MALGKKKIIIISAVSTFLLLSIILLIVLIPKRHSNNSGGTRRPDNSQDSSEETPHTLILDPYQAQLQDQILIIKGVSPYNRFAFLLDILEEFNPLFPLALRVLLREMLLDQSLNKPPFFHLNYLTLYYSNDLEMLLKLSKVSQDDLDGFSNGILNEFNTFIGKCFVPSVPEQMMLHLKKVL